MINELDLLWLPNFIALGIYFIFWTKFSWNEGIDTCCNVECVLLGCNFDFLGGYLVVTGCYFSLLSGYFLLLLVTWWLLLVTASYLLLPTYITNIKKHQVWIYSVIYTCLVYKILFWTVDLVLQNFQFTVNNTVLTCTNTFVVLKNTGKIPRYSFVLLYAFMYLSKTTQIFIGKLHIIGWRTFSFKRWFWKIVYVRSLDRQLREA